MKFLEKLYIDELNSTDSDRVQLKDSKLSDGTEQLMISIDGNEFLPSRILSDDETLFESSFNLWIEEREIRLADKATEILALYDNATRFDKLKRTYKANTLSPFLGAGLSMPSKYAGWTSFLYQLRNESDIEEITLSTLLSKGKYEEAAQALYDDLGAELFNEHLENEYSAEREIVGSINYLPKLFSSRSIITTNFDNIIERIFKEKNQSFDTIKSGKYLDEIQRQIAEGSRILIKLHGDCKQIADRVLTQSEYNLSYTDDKYLERFFKRVLISSSLLFIGCSLTQDRTFQTMIKIVTKEGASTLPRHFAFLEEIKDGTIRSKRKKELAKANIFPIWYPEGEHDESIEALFLKLMED